MKVEIPIFLCHAPQDKDFTKRIAKALEATGTFKAWTDERKILKKAKK